MIYIINNMIVYGSRTSIVDVGKILKDVLFVNNKDFTPFFFPFLYCFIILNLHIPILYNVKLLDIFAIFPGSSAGRAGGCANAAFPRNRD